MNVRHFHLHDGRKGSALAVRVIPRAHRNEIHEILADGTVKIRLTAPPVDGKANAALIAFLRDILAVPASRIEIVAGHTSRNKLVAIEGLDSEMLQSRIRANLIRG